MDRLKTPARLLATWEWLILLFLLVAVMFLAPRPAAVLLVLTALWLVRKVATGRFFPSTPFDLALGVLAVTIAISSLVTFAPEISWPKLTGLIVAMSLFHAAVNFCRLRADGLWILLAVTLAIGSGMALVGLLGSEWTGPFAVLNALGSRLPTSLQVVPGTVGGLVSANELAGALAWVAPLTIACLIGLTRATDGRRRPGLFILLIAAGAATSLTLLATMSRGGIVGFVAGLGLVVALFVEARWRFVVAVSLFVGALVMFFTYSNPQVETDVLGDTLGLRGRVEIWERGLQAVSDLPLTGVSMNGFRDVVGVVYPLFQTSPDIDLAHAHNHLLQTALDVGIPGLIAYLALWVVSAVLLWLSIGRMRRGHQTHHPLYAVAVGLAGSLLAGWLFGVADAIALGARPAFVWWLLLALTAATHFQIRFTLPIRTRVRKPDKPTGQPVREPPSSQRSLPSPTTPPTLTPPPSDSGVRRRPLAPRRPASMQVVTDDDWGII